MTECPFDSFIILADMRTGSNFLEANINSLPGLQSHGEAFNPVFMGTAGRTEMYGVTLEERERDPALLLRAMTDQQKQMPGFRFFSTHDPRVFDVCMADPRRAKIVLTRNPIDSYISLKIARETKQWRLGDLKDARRARVAFDRADFDAYLDRQQGFQRKIMRELQTSGQTAFYIGYEDVGDLEILNGLAAFLGADKRFEKTSDRTKVQNPEPLSAKVVNYDEMRAALADFDYFALGRTPNFEPRRGPNVPLYLTGADAPLLFMPVRGGPTEAVAAWLAGLDGVAPDALGRGLRQNDLRKWKRDNPGHRSFTVLRHPADRVHHAFCRHILTPGPECFAEIREILRSRYGLPVPQGAPGPDYDTAAHGRAFAAFLDFVRGNMALQTSLRVDPAWASQSMLIQGMGQVLLPDHLLREPDLPEALPRLARELGRDAPDFTTAGPDEPHTLDAIWTEELDRTIRDIYRRDFMMFGFDART